MRMEEQWRVALKGNAWSESYKTPSELGGKRGKKKEHLEENKPCRAYSTVNSLTLHWVEKRKVAKENKFKLPPVSAPTIGASYEGDASLPPSPRPARRRRRPEFPRAHSARARHVTFPAARASAFHLSYGTWSSRSQHECGQKARCWLRLNLPARRSEESRTCRCLLAELDRERNGVWGETDPVWGGTGPVEYSNPDPRQIRLTNLFRICGVKSPSISGSSPRTGLSLQSESCEPAFFFSPGFFFELALFLVHFFCPQQDGEVSL